MCLPPSSPLIRRPSFLSLTAYRAARLDSDPDTGIPLHELYEEVELTERVSARCHPEALQIPLLDLFVPRDRTKECPWDDLSYAVA